MITKKDQRHKARTKATEIKVPIWRFVHRLIATCIYLRKDGGRFVNLDDLDIMLCMHERRGLDPLICITKALEECHLKSFKSNSLGGGHFVTMLARHVGFSMDVSRELPKKTLGEDEWVSRRFVKQIKVNGCWVLFVAGRDQLPNEATPPSSPQYEQGGPSSTSHGSSSYDTLSRRLDDMAAWQNDVVSWHGDLMKGLCAHMGYMGYTSPPRPSFHYGTTMPPTEDNPMDDDFEDDEVGVRDVDETQADDDGSDDGDGGEDDTPNSCLGPDDYEFCQRDD